ncbi:MAG: carboxypeptidase-like regulatory domain-containing protein, partial [Planctomycetota bacterium]
MVDLVGRAALDPEAVLGEEFEIQAAVASGWGSLERSAFLGEDGGIRLGGLPPEEGWWIKLKAARFIDAEIAHARVALNARERVEIPVLRGVSAEGLLQAPDGSPVEGASVALRSWVRPGTRHLPGREVSVETDRDGRFFAGGVLAGQMTLFIEADGMLTKREELGERIDGEHVDASTIRLRGGGRVSGTVQEADGDPARGARVSVTISSRDWSTAEKVRTGKDGRFTVEGLIGDSFRVRASRKNKKTKQREIATTTALDGVDVVLTLERGLSVLGSVVDDEGTGLESFVVYAVPVGIDEGASPISMRVKKGDGAFELAGLTPGAYEFRATAKGYGKGGRLYLRLPKDAEPVEISLPRLCLFSGVLVDPAGTPVAEAEISG